MTIATVVGGVFGLLAGHGIWVIATDFITHHERTPR